MAKKERQRDVDYSIKELMETASLQSVNTLKNRLKKFCTIYNIDYNDFKLYPDEKGSEWFIPAEIGELLSICLKNLNLNPEMSRKSLNSISAHDILKYYESLIEDIDTSEYKFFTQIIHNLPSYLNTLEILFWGPKFLEEITFYLYNSIILSNQYFGNVLRDATIHFDKLNYAFAANDYIVSSVESTNHNVLSSFFTENELTLEEEAEFDIHLKQPNISIDKLLALLIKRFKIITDKTKVDKDFGQFNDRDSNKENQSSDDSTLSASMEEMLTKLFTPPEYIPDTMLIKSIEDLNRVMGVENIQTSNDSESLFEKRLTYLYTVFNNYLTFEDNTTPEEMINYQKNKQQQWQSIRTKIKKNDYSFFYEMPEISNLIINTEDATDDNKFSLQEICKTYLDRYEKTTNQSNDYIEFKEQLNILFGGVLHSMLK